MMTTKQRNRTRLAAAAGVHLSRQSTAAQGPILARSDATKGAHCG